MEGKNERPLVTIISLIYNNARISLAGLEAIRLQEYRPVEHIIFDDFSTDDSVQVIEDWIRKHNYQCRFVKHENNWGICATLNHGIELARGKYLFGITDDIMMPQKLLDDVVMLEEHPEYAFCYSKMILRNVDESEDIYAKYQYSDNMFHDYISGKIGIPTPTVTYRLSVFQDVGLFDKSILFEDFDMFLRILYKYKVGFIDKYTVIYQVHSQSIQLTKYIAILNEFLRVLDKWKFLPNYWYYKNNRHQFTFCQLAVKNKKEAVKHLLPSLTIFWKPRLYKNLLKLLFIWPEKKRSKFRTYSIF